LCIHALTDLCTCQMNAESSGIYTDSKEIPRVLLEERSFGELFHNCFYPIWNYGKKDLFVRNAFKQMIKKLRLLDRANKHQEVINAFEHYMQQPFREML